MALILTFMQDAFMHQNVNNMTNIYFSAAKCQPKNAQSRLREESFLHQIFEKCTKCGGWTMKIPPRPKLWRFPEAEFGAKGVRR